MSTINALGRVGKFNVLTRPDCLSSHAGMLLVNEFAARLGLSAVIDREVQVKQRRRGYGEAEALSGLIHNLILGGDCLNDLEVLRGDTGTLRGVLAA